MTVPDVPLFSDTVNVTVDLYNHFRGPNNISATLFYYVGTNKWNTWTEAEATSIPMSVLSNNPAARSVTYKTVSPIPTNASDTVIPPPRGDLGAERGKTRQPSLLLGAESAGTPASPPRL